MAEQINTKFHNNIEQNGNPLSPHNNESVDLDNLFAFLSDVPQQNVNSLIDEIGEKMDNLVEDLDIELESVIQQEIEGLTCERTNALNNNNINNSLNANNANKINNNIVNKPTTPKPLG